MLTICWSYLSSKIDKSLSRWPPVDSILVASTSVSFLPTILLFLGFLLLSYTLLAILPSRSTVVGDN